MNVHKVDLKKDRQTLLAFHCSINYESSSPALRRAYTYPQFHDVWIKSNDTKVFLSALKKSLKDPRTIAEIWEEGGEAVGYIWVKFIDWPDIKSTGAEIQDIFIAEAYRRRGIANQIFEHVEERVKACGANLLRSGTGIENLASQGLHAKFGFKASWIQYEKEL